MPWLGLQVPGNQVRWSTDRPSMLLRDLRFARRRSYPDRTPAHLDQPILYPFRSQIHPFHTHVDSITTLEPKAAVATGRSVTTRTIFSAGVLPRPLVGRLRPVEEDQSSSRFRAVFVLGWSDSNWPRLGHRTRWNGAFHPAQDRRLHVPPRAPIRRGPFNRLLHVAELGCLDRNARLALDTRHSRERPDLSPTTGRQPGPATAFRFHKRVSVDHVHSGSRRCANHRRRLTGCPTGEGSDSPTRPST